VLGKHTLKPGEKTELKVTFATINSPGLFEKIVTIDVDTPEIKQYEVIMTGNVKEALGAKISMKSRKVDLGVVRSGETKKQKILVNNPGELPLTIQQVSVKNGAAVALVVNSLPVVIAGGQSVEIELAITLGKPGGFSERVIIESNAKNVPKTGFVFQIIGKTE